MSEASDRWNAMPKSERTRLRGIIIERQILDYKLEIRRATSAYRKQINDIRSHLKSVEREYERWLRETASE